MDKFKKYFKKAFISVFRFEALQDYTAEDGQEMVDEYLNNGKLARPEYSSWWKEIKEKNEHGVLTQRVRLVDEPLNDYTKMELTYLKKAAAYSGEDIRIIREKDFKNKLNDFYLIDDKYLFILNYGRRGKFLSSEFVEGEKVKEYIKHKKILLNQSAKLI
ncbi:MAG TPA: hypothetical protein VFA52_00915 [Candidatus Paceibacterota bacterium]|nr:hypothetical protein [Candidatus Paceibacterota bacterium]